MQLTPSQQQFGHAGNNIRLRNCLPQTNRQGNIVIGAGGDSLVNEQVARHTAHGVQYTLVLNAHLLQTLDHACMRALRGHAATIHLDSHALKSPSWS